MSTVPKKTSFSPYRQFYKKYFITYRAQKDLISNSCLGFVAVKGENLFF